APPPHTGPTDPEARNAKLGPRGGTGGGWAKGGQADEEVPLLRGSERPEEDAGGGGKPRAPPPARVAGLPAVFMAGLSYCMASGCMVLLNKHALGSFGFTCPNSLLCFQCALTVLLVKASGMLGVVKLQPLKRDLVAVWFPVNVLFVLMLGSGFYALKGMGIGMFSVWKHLANIFIAVGDVFFFKKSYGWPVWGTLALMIVSAVVGASTDVRFSWVGYSWQLANCFFTAAYALYLRKVMDTVSNYTVDKVKMYYNNLLSIPLILGLMYAFGEYDSLQHQPALSNPVFLGVALLGGFLGFAISFTSLWFLSQTTATLFSLVGSLNKIPLAIVGMLAFHEPTNLKNLSSILIGLGAGVLFTKVKH
ncbi:GDP-mannose transporter GONST1, partial [Tetrabaena socialis]